MMGVPFVQPLGTVDQSAQVTRHMGEEELATSPADTTNGRAARAIAEVFDCSVEEAHRVLVLGIEARLAEQNARRAEQDADHGGH
jgi:hypothetical protein